MASSTEFLTVPTRQVTEFSDQGCGVHQRHAAHRLQGQHDRRQRPSRQQDFDLGGQPITTCRRRFDRLDGVLEHHVMRRLCEAQACQPAAVHQRPGRTMVVMAVTQQKARQLLAAAPQAVYRRLTGADQIAHRLMRLVRNPHRRQLARPMQLRQIVGVAPVGLDAIARTTRNQRGSHHHACMTCCAQPALDAVAAGTGLVAEAQFAAIVLKFAH
jgi:hypothetical protein